MDMNEVGPGFLFFFLFVKVVSKNELDLMLPLPEYERYNSEVISNSREKQSLLPIPSK